jgi:hypothetical protein
MFNFLMSANKSAFDAARAIMNFIGNFGTPLRIRSDGGGEFVNGVIVGLTRLMGVSQHVVQAYTPTANGIVERANRATNGCCLVSHIQTHIIYIICSHISYIIWGVVI